MNTLSRNSVIATMAFGAITAGSLYLTTTAANATENNNTSSNCTSGSGCVPPSYGNNSPTPTTGGGSGGNTGGNCGPGGCGGVTITNPPQTTVNSQSSNNQGSFFNQGGSATNFAFSRDGGAVNNLFGCSTSSPEIGGFLTGSYNHSQTEGYYNNNGASGVAIQGGVFATVPLNPRERDTCQLHGILTTLNSNIKVCVELRDKGLRVIPDSFTAVYKGSARERALASIMACNELLTANGQHPIQLPPAKQLPPVINVPEMPVFQQPAGPGRN